MRSLAFPCALTLAVLAAGACQARQKATARSVDTLAFAPRGSIHLDDSFGEVSVEGWDRNEVELTVLKSTRRQYSGTGRARARAELDRVRVSARREGAESLVISTAFPARNWLTRPLRGKSNLELTYRLKVPRRSNLYIRHDIGEVNVRDVIGHIEVSSRIGEISLQLPAREEYTIDARSGIGDVSSDFAGGQTRSQHLVGEKLAESYRPDAHQVILRVGIGDIQIRKIPQKIVYV